MFDFFVRRGGAATTTTTSSSSSSTLPLYSPLSARTFDEDTDDTTAFSTSPSSSTDDDVPLEDLVLKPAQRHAISTTTTTTIMTSRDSWRPTAHRPSLSRFLADFTLGFADGLTVPFALTAGLSSLGQTDTVIYAGMAEICAGSISMGIGGYLSAKGDAQQTSTSSTGTTVCGGGRRCLAAAAAAADEEEGVNEEEACLHGEKLGAQQILTEATVEGYLAPLHLPPELLNRVRDHVRGRADVATALGKQMWLRGGSDYNDDDDDGDEDEDAPPSPIMSGLSVALGYLIGGSLPLFPYFVVSHVGDGLLWSFVVCIIALFAFGFIKDLVLHIRKESDVWIKDKDLGRRRWAWSDVRRSSWEGLQMVLLGSMAALAAVLCVRLFDSMGHNASQS